jgi:hypothetical protein
VQEKSGGFTFDILSGFLLLFSANINTGRGDKSFFPAGKWVAYC